MNYFYRLFSSFLHPEIGGRTATFFTGTKWWWIFQGTALEPEQRELGLEIVCVKRKENSSLILYFWKWALIIDTGLLFLSKDSARNCEEKVYGITYTPEEIVIERGFVEDVAFIDMPYPPISFKDKVCPPVEFTARYKVMEGYEPDSFRAFYTIETKRFHWIPFLPYVSNHSLSMTIQQFISGQWYTVIIEEEATKEFSQEVERLMGTIGMEVVHVR